MRSSIAEEIVLLILGCMMLVPVLGSATETSPKGPKAILSEEVYEFQPVIEGSQVVHEFVLHNRGDEPLQIIKIESGCGCTAASGTRQIPPGKEGRIEVKINTGGYGGGKIRESVRIRTNDPIRPWLGIAVTGMVEKFAEIRPEPVQLVGPVGQSLSAEVEIIPRKDYPFTIVDIKAKNGNFFRFALTRRCTDGFDRCIVRADNIRTEKGRYVDILYVSTSSKLRPVIPIYVIGLIR